jgi:N utilization substance protein A
LTGYDIDVFREQAITEEDVKLEEFADEIDGWVIDALKAIGCDTAKSVIELGFDELSKRTDLEDETIEDVLNVLKAEFE